MRKSKGLMLIQDGVGDRPIYKLGRRTPLEAANTPNMDNLARNAINGLVDPLAPGIRVGTDVGTLALFGYNPLKTYWGRGPIEAVGINMKLQPQDVALRCNFATVDDEMKVIDRRAGRIREGTRKLAASLNGLDVAEGIEVEFKEATEHRAVLVLRGDKLSPEITDTDPGPASIGKKVRICEPSEPGLKLAQKTADVVNEFVKRSHEILKDHPVNQARIQKGEPPANIILTRGAGSPLRMRSMAERFGLKGACIAGESTVLGVARMAGFEVFTSPRFTANVDTILDEKARYATEALKVNDLVVLHVKGTDILSHDNNPLDKMHFIEKIDEMLGSILAQIDDDIYVALAADHSTPCEV
ncbi:MAG: 2,3-bisphosphoglycerate-independent phosphoglycerate mutase, partial [Candidatus Coatesbacteria bacterium]|nr:2,3-bisphosphoglycerate-independent phosphoglycerate mutase [Candidatus Coatesbacteria bacterium]